MNRRTLFPILTALPAAIATAISQSKAIPANNAAKELHIGGEFPGFKVTEYVGRNVDWVTMDGTHMNNNV